MSQSGIWTTSVVRPHSPWVSDSSKSWSVSNDRSYEVQVEPKPLRSFSFDSHYDRPDYTLIIYYIIEWLTVLIASGNAVRSLT